LPSLVTPFLFFRLCRAAFPGCFPLREFYVSSTSYFEAVLSKLTLNRRGNIMKIRAQTPQASDRSIRAASPVTCLSGLFLASFMAVARERAARSLSSPRLVESIFPAFPPLASSFVGLFSVGPCRTLLEAVSSGNAVQVLLARERAFGFSYHSLHMWARAPNRQESPSPSSAENVRGFRYPCD